MSKDNNRNNSIPEKSLSTSVGGYWVIMGTDGERGPGKIVIGKEKSVSAMFSYVDWQKIDAFLTQNNKIFNFQLKKEIEEQNVIRER